ncbi:MAG: hypothetical protein COT37_01870 [Parcubacteria group bacterium CG08_land_8_20_14_0_20_43_9]|nr:MAG: hypothetical protein COT37_01870 [Parcubacteria group bacterium CG08_land_8_20_14_0_20_43_9]
MSVTVLTGEVLTKWLADGQPWRRQPKGRTSALGATSQSVSLTGSAMMEGVPGCDASTRSSRWGDGLVRLPSMFL